MGAPKPLILIPALRNINLEIQSSLCICLFPYDYDLWVNKDEECVEFILILDLWYTNSRILTFKKKIILKN